MLNYVNFIVSSAKSEDVVKHGDSYFAANKRELVWYLKKVVFDDLWIKHGNCNEDCGGDCGFDCGECCGGAIVLFNSLQGSDFDRLSEQLIDIDTMNDIWDEDIRENVDVMDMDQDILDSASDECKLKICRIEFANILRGNPTISCEEIEQMIRNQGGI